MRLILVFPPPSLVRAPKSSPKARKDATQDADTSGGDGATMSAQNDLGSFWKYDMKEGFSTVGTVSEASGEWRVDPRQLSSKRKRELLKEHFKPSRNFPFVARNVGNKKLKVSSDTIIG